MCANNDAPGACNRADQLAAQGPVLAAAQAVIATTVSNWLGQADIDDWLILGSN